MTLRGLTTVSFYADDVAAAAAWYTELLGIEPYFQRLPGYVEFRIGDHQHELGIVARSYAPHGAEIAGAIVYWHVDDVETTLARLLAMGAKEHEGITKRGEGYVTASVVDPFGNLLGIMYNQHYLDTVAARKSG